MFSTPPTARSRTRTAALIGVALILVLAVAVTCRGDSDPDGDGASTPGASASTTPTAPESPTPTPLAEVDTTALTVQRADFCALVDDVALETALGGAPGDPRTYGNGESTVLTSEVTDIAAEHGCRWKRGRTVARAWVFAPPVTSADAKRLTASARSAEGCDVRRDAPAFGSPSVARTCPVGEGFEASYRGLFGDAWLACSLTAPGTRRATLTGAGAWCVAVAEAAAQPPA